MYFHHLRDVPLEGRDFITFDFLDIAMRESQLITFQAVYDTDYSNVAEYIDLVVARVIACSQLGQINQAINLITESLNSQFFQRLEENSLYFNLLSAINDELTSLASIIIDGLGDNCFKSFRFSKWITLDTGDKITAALTSIYIDQSSYKPEPLLSFLSSSLKPLETHRRNLLNRFPSDNENESRYLMLRSLRQLIQNILTRNAQIEYNFLLKSFLNDMIANEGARIDSSDNTFNLEGGKHSLFPMSLFSDADQSSFDFILARSLFDWYRRSSRCLPALVTIVEVSKPVVSENERFIKSTLIMALLVVSVIHTFSSSREVGAENVLSDADKLTNLWRLIRCTPKSFVNDFGSHCLLLDKELDDIQSCLAVFDVVQPHISSLPPPAWLLSGRQLTATDALRCRIFVDEINKSPPVQILDEKVKYVLSQIGTSIDEFVNLDKNVRFYVLDRLICEMCSSVGIRTRLSTRSIRESAWSMVVRDLNEILSIVSANTVYKGFDVQLTKGKILSTFLVALHMFGSSDILLDAFISIHSEESPSFAGPSNHIDSSVSDEFLDNLSLLLVHVDAYNTYVKVIVLDAAKETLNSLSSCRDGDVTICSHVVKLLVRVSHDTKIPGIGEERALLDLVEAIAVIDTHVDIVPLQLRLSNPFEINRLILFPDQASQVIDGADTSSFPSDIQCRIEREKILNIHKQHCERRDFLHVIREEMLQRLTIVDKIANLAIESNNFHSHITGEAKVAVLSAQLYSQLIPSLIHRKEFAVVYAICIKVLSVSSMLCAQVHAGQDLSIGESIISVIGDLEISLKEALAPFHLFLKDVNEGNINETVKDIYRIFYMDLLLEVSSAFKWIDYPEMFVIESFSSQWPIQKSLHVESAFTEWIECFRRFHSHDTSSLALGIADAETVFPFCARNHKLMLSIAVAQAAVIDDKHELRDILDSLYSNVEASIKHANPRYLTADDIVENAVVEVVENESILAALQKKGFSKNGCKRAIAAVLRSSNNLQGVVDRITDEKWRGFIVSASLKWAIDNCHSADFDNPFTLIVSGSLKSSSRSLVSCDIDTSLKILELLQDVAIRLCGELWHPRPITRSTKTQLTDLDNQISSPNRATDETITYDMIEREAFLDENSRLASQSTKIKGALQVAEDFLTASSQSPSDSSTLEKLVKMTPSSLATLIVADSRSDSSAEAVEALNIIVERLAISTDHAAYDFIPALVQNIPENLHFRLYQRLDTSVQRYCNSVDIIPLEHKVSQDMILWIAASHRFVSLIKSALSLLSDAALSSVEMNLKAIHSDLMTHPIRFMVLLQSIYIDHSVRKSPSGNVLALLLLKQRALLVLHECDQAIASAVVRDMTADSNKSEVDELELISIVCKHLQEDISTLRRISRIPGAETVLAHHLLPSDKLLTTLSVRPVEFRESAFLEMFKYITVGSISAWSRAVGRNIGLGPLDSTFLCSLRLVRQLFDDSLLERSLEQLTSDVLTLIPRLSSTQCGITLRIIAGVAIIDEFVSAHSECSPFRSILTSLQDIAKSNVARAYLVLQQMESFDRNTFKPSISNSLTAAGPVIVKKVSRSNRGLGATKLASEIADAESVSRIDDAEPVGGDFRDVIKELTLFLSTLLSLTPSLHDQARYFYCSQRSNGARVSNSDDKTVLDAVPDYASVAKTASWKKSLLRTALFQSIEKAVRCHFECDKFDHTAPISVENSEIIRLIHDTGLDCGLQTLTEGFVGLLRGIQTTFKYSTDPGNLDPIERDVRLVRVMTDELSAIIMAVKSFGAGIDLDSLILNRLLSSSFDEYLLWCNRREETLSRRYVAHIVYLFQSLVATYHDLIDDRGYFMRYLLFESYLSLDAVLEADSVVTVRDKYFSFIRENLGRILELDKEAIDQWSVNYRDMILVLLKQLRQGTRSNESFRTMSRISLSLRCHREICRESYNRNKLRWGRDRLSDIFLSDSFNALSAVAARTDDAGRLDPDTLAELIGTFCEFIRQSLDPISLKSWIRLLFDALIVDCRLVDRKYILPSETVSYLLSTVSAAFPEDSRTFIQIAYLAGTLKEEDVFARYSNTLNQSLDDADGRVQDLMLFMMVFHKCPSLTTIFQQIFQHSSIHRELIKQTGRARNNHVDMAYHHSSRRVEICLTEVFEYRSLFEVLCSSTNQQASSPVPFLTTPVGVALCMVHGGHVVEGLHFYRSALTLSSCDTSLALFVPSDVLGLLISRMSCHLTDDCSLSGRHQESVQIKRWGWNLFDVLCEDIKDTYSSLIQDLD